MSKSVLLMMSYWGRGGGGLEPDDVWMTKGGGGVENSLKIDDVIYG